MSVRGNFMEYLYSQKCAMMHQTLRNFFKYNDFFLFYIIYIFVRINITLGKKRSKIKVQIFFNVIKLILVNVYMNLYEKIDY